MNAHTKINAMPADRMDEIVSQLSTNIASWRRADEVGDRYAEKRLSSRRQVIEAESSWLPCRGAAAALVKLCTMEADVEAALTHIEDEDLQMQTVDLLGRHVGSLIRWIEQEYGIRREDYQLQFYHSDRTERAAWCMGNDEGEKIPS